MSRDLREGVRRCFPKSGFRIREYKGWLSLGWLYLGITLLRFAIHFWQSLFSPESMNMPPQTTVFWREATLGGGLPSLLGVCAYSLHLFIYALLTAVMVWRLAGASESRKVKAFFLCFSVCAFTEFITYPLDIRFGSVIQLLLFDFVECAFLLVGTLCLLSGVRDVVKRREGGM